MPWRRMMFKGHKVHAETDDRGDLQLSGGLVRIKYNLDQSHEYRVPPAAVAEIDEAQLVRAGAGPSRAPKPAAAAARRAAGARKATPAAGVARVAGVTGGVVEAWTDGACSGNPGPMGAGVVLIAGARRKEISRHLGEGTNNVAELMAIEIALESLRRKDLSVRVYTDSSYSIGVLQEGHKIVANRDLVARIRHAMEAFRDLKLVKVEGHAGNPENERADALARAGLRPAT